MNIPNERNCTFQAGNEAPCSLQGISPQILNGLHYNLPTAGFFREALKTLLTFSPCELVNLYLRENGNTYLWQASRLKNPQAVDISSNKPEKPSGEGLICDKILWGHINASDPDFTAKGSFWTNDASKPAAVSGKKIKLDARFPSLALIPVSANSEVLGVIGFHSAKKGFFSGDKVSRYESFVDALGIILANQRAHAALRERVKELTCLYEIARITDSGKTLDEMLGEIAAVLPAAWQYPEAAVAEILLDNKVFATGRIKKDYQKQISGIVSNGRRRGKITVAYRDKKADLDEGPFLEEERRLIETLAKQIALLVEQRKAVDERKLFQAQLRHADRLATMGQLTAGIAHELNEPLGNILGYAQLVKKVPGLPWQAAADIAKIEAASLHAREVVRKLLTFARQVPISKSAIDINLMIREDLLFFESRCSKSGIELVRHTDPARPMVFGDPVQIKQVLVNLVVNAIQAMPCGGKLTVTTAAENGFAILTVEDTGTGMTEAVKKLVFTPFFTTKDIGEGTGLGLAVSYGIVTSHKGFITFKSRPGKGSEFTVKLPLAIQGGNNALKINSCGGRRTGHS